MPQFPLYTKSNCGEFYKTISHDKTITVKKHEAWGKTVYSIAVGLSPIMDQYENHKNFSYPSTRDEFEKLYEEAHWHINKANTPQ